MNKEEAFVHFNQLMGYVLAQRNCLCRATTEELSDYMNKEFFKKNDK